MNSTRACSERGSLMSDSFDFTFVRLRDGKVRVLGKHGAPIKVADRVDPGSAVSRARFIKAVREAMPGVDHEALERQLLELADQPAQLPQPETDDPSAASDAALAEMPDEVREGAAEMLRKPDLVEQVLRDLQAIGIVGEHELALTTYLVGSSRLLAKPLAALVQGATSSGKSHVVERTAETFPPEAKLLATDITQQALYYLPYGSLRHRFVVAGERSRLQDD